MNKYTGCWMVIIVIALSPFIWMKIMDILAVQENAQEQLGAFYLNLEKSEMGDYKNDCSLFEDLSITFSKDRTFVFNKSVPFIFDSIGVWRPQEHGLEEWAWLTYQSKNDLGFKVEDQFSGILLDSSFEIQPIAKKGSRPVKKLVFCRARSCGN